MVIRHWLNLLFGFQLYINEMSHKQIIHAFFKYAWVWCMHEHDVCMSMMCARAWCAHGHDVCMSMMCAWAWCAHEHDMRMIIRLLHLTAMDFFGTAIRLLFNTIIVMPVLTVLLISQSNIYFQIFSSAWRKQFSDLICECQSRLYPNRYGFNVHIFMGIHRHSAQRMRKNNNCKVQSSLKLSGNHWSSIKAGLAFIFSFYLIRKPQTIYLLSQLKASMKCFVLQLTIFHNY